MKRTVYRELRELLTCHNDLQAQIIKGVLEENLIEVFIQKDDCGGMEPQLQITEGIKVLVLSDQFKQAEELVESFAVSHQDGAEETRPHWQCDTCKEILEDQYTDCWNCGSARSLASPDNVK
jgi:hypothetical protein